MKCTKCQVENPKTSLFCASCGTKLEAAKELSLTQTETLQTPIKELTTGSTFAGRYQIIEELGKGGMGKVYRVLDNKLNEEVALKLIRPEIALDKKILDRFSSELKIARKIVHKNVGRMYHLSEDKGTYYITMEYVAGENLKSSIRRFGPLPIGKVIFLAEQMCDGLAEAHRLGIVHRDLKPGNIMIDDEGNARIMDFGIARSLKERGITGEGVIIGTPEYMSPEQMEGKEVDQRSDIYSLGVILYEMVTGGVPFSGDTPLTVAVKQKTEVAQDPRKLNDLLPEDLSRMILCCLEKEKEKRYQSVEELQTELTRIKEEFPATERAISKKKSTKIRKIGGGRAKTNWAKIGLYAGAVIFLALMVYTMLHIFSGRSAVIDSIAVLPFENVNADPNTDYLCDGITETIINKLSPLSCFKTVINRASVFSYKGKTVDPKKVGQELGVKAVLLTRIVRLGDRLTISPTLVRTRDNSQLWGERYDRRFEDILSIEEDIATSIVQALRLKLNAADKDKISERPIDNAAAYECYLRAWHEIGRFKEGSIDRAVQDLQSGLDIIGPNPLLYSAMANAYYQYVNIGVRQEDYLERAENYANKALALDPNFSRAHGVMGSLYYFTNQHESIRHYKKALALNPNEPYALLGLILNYQDVGKLSAALPLIERRRKVDPLNPDNFMLQGFSALYDGQFGLALELFRKWYQSDPESPVKEYHYALQLAYNKAFDEALPIIEKCAEADPNNALSKFGLLLKCGLLKDRGKAFQIMTPDFRKTCLRDCEWSYYVAISFALLDEKKEALDWLENAIDRGFINYPFMSKYDWFLDNIRGEERFKKLMERVKYEGEHFEE